jgi:epidermal growth factor receptor substrate 15
MNSGLPVDVLGRIWELSDLDQDGQLDRDEFLIALQLINKAKEGNTIPDQLPPSLLPFKVRHSSLPTPLAAGLGNVPVAAFPLLINETKPWIVTIEEKAKSDITFNQLDTDKDGYVNGLECKDVFLKTGLSQVILANIWNLCDMGSTGKLNCEQFALAMHFINKKLATGLDAPPELLPEMVPPSLRPKPILTEEAHVSKEFEELQTQVTELQREKLYYEQRASEHDMITRQKRTELSNLELEMESLFKTLQEREMKKSEEQKKLVEFEDKLTKLDTQLKDVKEKYESEKSAIEKLKLQIQHMETAMKSKDNDLKQIRTDLQFVMTEQSNFEYKLNTRKTHLTELNNNMAATSNEIEKNKSKIELLKLLQVNINKLIKEYDTVPINSKNTVASDLSDEIKKLEEENYRLNEEIKLATENVQAASLYTQSQQLNNHNNTSFSPTSISNDNNSQFQANFNNFFSPSSQTQNSSEFPSVVDDPFQTFDPFNSNDPFKAAPVGGDIAAVINPAEDPFGNAYDPFSQQQQAQNNQFQTNFNAAFGSEDPFSSNADSKKKPPPPRPAPPRPQTPSLKPNKKPTDSFQRPQSALDFTRNNKLDLFNDFSDPFQPNQNTVSQPPQVSTNNKGIIFLL